ncbi:hypothetical protein [Sphingobium algorifonticola]|uniref:Uncharacterized protein n=1 Tax=Sphingobium algorifonticola TaxID=2008318 RepID=A0A437J2A4_9SPHN|nr:hypothetical protein [Sphingobium algorifonticola]RVT38265.1 hypothetical protein ENE74_17835 [Sphingobium algorifonticola]
MSAAQDETGLSSKRRQLCSRDHALRVAARMFDRHPARLAIVATGDPLQPYRVSIDPAERGQAVAELVA